MITIQTNPALRAFPTFSVAALALGGLLTALIGRFVDLEDSWFLVAPGLAVLAMAGLMVGVGLAYRPFAFDPGAGTARIGNRTVPISSIREAWRSVSAGGNGAAYLIYGFRSTDGVTARVVVAGRPMPGLDDAGRAALLRFLELAPIADPHTGAEQLASNVLADGKKVPASATALSAELRGDSPAAAAPVTPGADPATPSADEPLVAAMLADEEAAVAALQPLAGLLRARQVAGLGLAVSLIGAIVGAIGMIIASAVGVDIEVPATGVAVGVVLGAIAVSGLVWSILADVAARRIRAAGRRWLEYADRDARGRGLPATFAGAWFTFPPGDRLGTILAFSAGVLGLGAVIGGPVAMTMDVVLGGLVALLVGVGLSALAIRFWVRHRRRRRADTVWVVEKLGPRAGLMGG